MAQRRTSYDRFSEMEEGWRDRDAHSQYGARLTSLVLEFARLDGTDQEFLRTLLSHGANAESESRQGVRNGRAESVGPYSRLTPSSAGTPGSYVGSGMSRDANTPRYDGAGVSGSRMPGSVSFRDEEPSGSWSSTPHQVGSYRQGRMDGPWDGETAGTKPGNPVGSYVQGYSYPPSVAAPMPPKLAAFSGEGLKNEPSYAQWRSEVQSILRAGLYQEPMIMTNVRRSLRGRAADVLLAMGTDVRVQQVLDKFDVRFGDVCPTDMTLEKFFTARQLPTESMSAWGCRLEDIVSRILKILEVQHLLTACWERDTGQASILTKFAMPFVTILMMGPTLSPSLGANVTSRVRAVNDKRLSWGVYWCLFVIYQNSPEKIQRHITNTDKIQQNAQSFYIAHTLIYSPFIHSFIHSSIHSFTSHHSCITHASPIHHTLHHTMHHPFITLHLNASYHASPIRHTASQHIIPVKQYIQQITLTHNALDASQRWCIITIMHHNDDASQQYITTLMHYGTTSL